MPESSTSLEHVLHAPFDLILRHSLALQAESDVVEHAQVREQRVRLEDRVHVSLVRRPADDVAVAEVDVPVFGPRSRRSCAGSSSPAAGRTEQREETAVLHCSERLSTATTSSKRFVTSTRRTSRGRLSHRRRPRRTSPRPSRTSASRARGRGSSPSTAARRRADAVRQLEQVPPVRADELDENVKLPRRDDDVPGLVPARDLVSDVLRRPRRLDADHRHSVEPEPSGFVTAVTWMMPSSQRRAYRVRTVASDTPRSAAMRRNESRPFSCSASMMRASTASRRRGRDTAPRRDCALPTSVDGCAMRGVSTKRPRIF